MKIKDFIIDMLNQMNDLKSEKSKTNYIVQEIEFELSLVVNDNKSEGINVSSDFFGLFKLAGEGQSEQGKESIHKVKIKLEPKKIKRSINN
jgi:hypothetical protein